MPFIILSQRHDAPPALPAFEMTAALTGRVGGFLELSQMLTGRVPLRELVLDTYLTGVVIGLLVVAISPMVRAGSSVSMLSNTSTTCGTTKVSNSTTTAMATMVRITG